MKIKLLAGVLIWGWIWKPSSGQSILNPSFENVNTPPCALNLNNSSFNGLILNVTAFGTYESCDIMSGTCGYGAAQQGNWFIGLSVPPGGGSYDAIAIELSSPLQSGQPYEFSFYQKKDSAYDSNPLDIGYSTNNTSMGASAAALGAVTSTSWTFYSVVFTPAFNASYITIRVAPGTYGWNHFDNLHITNVTAVNEEKSDASVLNIYPNPATDKINISFPAPKGVLWTTTSGNITLKIYSVTGENLFQSFRTLEKVNATTIDVTGLSNGIYFLSVQTGKEVVTGKIVVNH